MNQVLTVSVPTLPKPLRKRKPPFALAVSPELGRQLALVHQEKKAAIVREDERLQAFLRELADRD